MNLRERLFRHLSFANVVACTALFVALGGGAYAATNIDGNSIKKESIGGGKLKVETITSKQIKKGTLNGSVIDVATLGTVPSAQTAATAGSATTAGSANSANTANTASTATKAETAGHADNADFAETADHADSATNADELGGETATELSERLTLACDPSTQLFGGMCWDRDPRPDAFWVKADTQCAAAGARLPTLGELIAYVLQPGPQVSGQTWSGEVIDVEGGVAKAATTDETVRATAGEETIKLGFRCVFLPTNVHNG